MNTTQIDEGAYRSLQWRVNHIRKITLLMGKTENDERRRHQRRSVIERLYEIKILCQTFNIDFLNYLKEKDIILVEKNDGKIDVHVI